MAPPPTPADHEAAEPRGEATTLAPSRARALGRVLDRPEAALAAGVATVLAFVSGASPPPPPPPAPSPTDDTLSRLKELGELKAAGVLTEAEFEAQKAKILAG